jgi:hypothetical protein
LHVCQKNVVGSPPPQLTLEVTENESLLHFCADLRCFEAQNQAFPRTSF